MLCRYLNPSFIFLRASNCTIGVVEDMIQLELHNNTHEIDALNIALYQRYVILLLLKPRQVRARHQSSCPDLAHAVWMTVFGNRCRLAFEISLIPIP